MKDFNEIKKVSGEDKYIEYDEEFDLWGIFGVDSGFCYGFYFSQEEADIKLKERFNEKAT